MAKKRSTAKTVEAALVSGSAAAVLLGVGQTKFWQMSKAGIFTVRSDPRGRKAGRRTYYHKDELDLFIETNDVGSVRDYRRRKKRLKGTGA